jgi:hypothetical protein
MQLEELQQQWRDLDAKLDRSLRLDAEILRQTVLQPARRRMNRHAVWPALDCAFAAAVLLIGGSVLGDHWQAWSLVAPTALLMIAAILLLGSSIWQLQLVAAIDWSGAVADLQRSLLRLRLARIEQLKHVLLLSPLVGFCGLLVALQWLLDRLPQPELILDKLDPRWVAANYAFGVLFVFVGHGVVRFLARRFHASAWWQRALDALSGKSVERTIDEVTRWSGLDAASTHELA